MSPGGQAGPVVATDCFIPGRDGVELAARVWKGAELPPEGATAVLEVTPYRLRDVSAVRDSENHSYLAGCGYVSVRTDMRGTGDSTGLAGAMLSRHERHDTLAVVEWITGQPWSNGGVVLFGISWGAVNAMLAAAEGSPAIRAVVAVAFYDDAYQHGLVLKGGCLTNEAVGWSAAVLGYNARPPSRAGRPKDWLDLWQHRIEGAEQGLETVLLHPFRDAYWDERTIADLASVRVPVLIMSGAHDGSFTSCVPRAIAALEDRLTAVVGPWSHRWPHLAVPGPGIPALPVAREWLDAHVRGTGVGTRFRLGRSAVWVEEGRPAQAYYAKARGSWVGVPNGALAGADKKRLFLTDAGLSARPGPQTTAELPFQGVAGGLCAGEMMPAFNFGPGAEFPVDQRRDDAYSLAFDTLPLVKPLMVLGIPSVRLRLKVDAQVAQVCVRLCEVNPGGRSTRITYGARNLCLLDDRAPQAVRPGRWLELTVPLEFYVYRFSQGCRLRVSISTAYWPLLWPCPAPVALTVALGASHIDLPMIPKAATTLEPGFFGTAEALPGFVQRSDLRGVNRRRSLTHNPFEAAYQLRIDDDGGRYRLQDTGSEVEATMRERYAVVEPNPLSARATVDWTWMIDQPSCRTRVRSSTSLTGSRDAFKVHTSIRAFNGGEELLHRKWARTIPRDFL